MSDINSKYYILSTISKTNNFFYIKIHESIKHYFKNLDIVTIYNSKDEIFRVCKIIDDKIIFQHVNSVIIAHKNKEVFKVYLDGK